MNPCLPAGRPPSVSARLRFASASKTEKFSLHFFIRTPPKFFSIKETKIFLFCLPADAGIAETFSHPIPPSAESKRAKIHFPHTPFSFCPLAFGLRPIFFRRRGYQIEGVHILPPHSLLAISYTLTPIQ